MDQLSISGLLDKRINLQDQDPAKCKYVCSNCQLYTHNTCTRNIPIKCKIVVSLHCIAIYGYIVRLFISGLLNNGQEAVVALQDKYI